ncbi:MAG TPA: S53 family peptidase [Bryobacteraceae bacterium]
MPNEHTAVRGSAKQPRPDAHLIGKPDPGERISVTVLLRRRAQPPAPGGPVISREEFAARYGAAPEDVDAVERFAAANDLSVAEVNLARRSVVLTGTIANMSEAFGTELGIYHSAEGQYRGRTGSVYVPAELSAAIEGVFGLDERPQTRARFRRHLPGKVPHAAGDTSYTPVEVARLYDYPENQGAGQCVAIIELGGGFRAADLKQYFTGLGISPVPSVTAVSVDGGHNHPTGDPNSADGEVLLDIEVAGAIAPQARIAVYFAPNTDQGFLDAITTAVHDTVHKPSVISISWGSAESAWTDQSLNGFDQAFSDAGLLGVTVCCASGDDGSADGVTDGAAHVDFPSSSPHALACGGTRLEATDGEIKSEVVWSHGAGNGATGGGVSEKFPLPSWQSASGVPPSVNPGHFIGRGVPDLAGNADPATGYQILVDGRSAVLGGTSAVAPLIAALIALLNEKQGQPLGFVNAALYSRPDALRDVTSGDNGAYAAGSGWDACTGLGSPDGQKLLGALVAAGVSRRALGAG